MTNATKVFVPFSNELWGLLLAVTIGMSLVEVYIFRDQWRKDGYDEFIEDMINAAQSLKSLDWSDIRAEKFR